MSKVIGLGNKREKWLDRLLMSAIVLSVILNLVARKLWGPIYNDWPIALVITAAAIYCLLAAFVVGFLWRALRDWLPHRKLKSDFLLVLLGLTILALLTVGTTNFFYQNSTLEWVLLGLLAAVMVMLLLHLGLDWRENRPKKFNGSN